MSSVTDQSPESLAAPPAGWTRVGPARVILKPRRARPFFGRHPWVFAGSIARLEGDPPDGAEVLVHAHDGQFIARGLYNSRSQIRVRLYTWEQAQELDDAFWRQQLVAAIELRRDVLKLTDPAAASRLVFSESDGLSGLVVDRYGPWLVIQITSLALAMRLEKLVALLVELCQPHGIYLRTERGVGSAEGLALTDRPLWGRVPADSVTIVENDLEFEVDVVTGQKTGFYIDQRENRRAIQSYAGGRRVLDLFSYTGGFALAAAAAGALEVVGIDSSESAIAAAQRNQARNRTANTRFQAADAFKTLERLACHKTAPERFGMVILDPPKFARQSRSVQDALRGYKRANLLAVQLLERNGILVTCSCSAHVSREQFAAVLGTVAEQIGRPIQILAQRGQAADHPVSASCPETAYLKCFVARVV